MIVLLYGFFPFFGFSIGFLPTFLEEEVSFLRFGRWFYIHTYDNIIMIWFVCFSPLFRLAIFSFIYYIYIYIYNLCIVDPIRGFACQAHTFFLSFVVLLFILLLILFACTSSLSFLRGIFFWYWSGRRTSRDKTLTVEHSVQYIVQFHLTLFVQS
jgi:hypothetical protein